VHQQTRDLREREKTERDTCPGVRRARTGGHGDGWWRERGCVVAAVLPVTSANPRSVGVVGGSKSNAVNLVLRAPAPTSVNIALPQGPTNHIRVDAPDQGAREGVDRVVGLDPL
jgi:hypothetical protein